MRIVAILILGLLIGWLIEWALDYFFWRRRATEEVDELEEELEEAMEDIEEMEEQLAAAQAQPALPPAVIVEERQIVKEIVIVRQKEDVAAINGIGPTYRKRLAEAGITSYLHVAEQTPERLREICLIKEWQKADPADWIEQAKQMARQVEEETTVKEEVTMDEVRTIEEVHPTKESNPASEPDPDATVALPRTGKGETK